MVTKVKLDFLTIRERLKALELPEFDWVVGIATGGIVPASLVAYEWSRPLALLQINYRDQANVPQHPAPVLLSEADLPLSRQRILLVDDVCVSGRTMNLAKELLSEHDITTLVMKGQGDYVLFPEIGECVHWPWKTE